LDQSNYFSSIGVPACFEFGVDQLAVHNNIKNAAGACLQFRIDAVFFFDFRCDTRSLRAVVSFTAVLDQNFHRTLLFRRKP
jgi:hypothetical protein